MSIVCPNPNYPDFVKLTEQLGEKEAYRQYMLNANEIPNPDLYENIIKDYTDDDIPLSDDKLYELANGFLKKLKVQFDLISEEDVKLYNERNPGRRIGNTTKGFYDSDSNKIYLIKGRAGFYTTLHEFTHPLVEWLYRNNNTLFKTMINKLKVEALNQPGYWIDRLRALGYNDYIVNGEITTDGWKELLTLEIEKASRTILNNSGVKPGSFIDSVKLFWKKIKEAIGNLVGKNIGKLNEKQLMNLTINDLATFMLDGDVKLDLYSPFISNLKQVPNESFGKLYFSKGSPKFQSAVSAQVADYKKRTGKDITSNQLRVINTLVAMQSLTKNKDVYFDSVTGVDFQRATQFIKTLKGPNGEEGFYEYKGSEDDEVGLKAAERGNQIDDLVQFIIEGLDVDSAINQVIDNRNTRTKDNPEINKVAVDEEVLKELYNSIKNVIGNKFKDYIVLPQVVLADPEKGIAGTADIFLISPEGKVRILDVKTSKYSTDGVTFTKNYGDSASVKQKYTAQLSVYKALAKSMGLMFEESDDLSIIPVYFPGKSIEEIDEARLEPEVKISALNYILEMFNIGETTAPEETLSDDPEVNLIKKVKVILTKRLSEINKMPAGYRKESAKSETESILNTLNQAESIKKLTEFVTGLHKQFTNQIKESKSGKKYTIFGLPSQIKYITLQLASGEINREEALSKFLYIKNINDLYSPILEDIRNIINSKDDETVKSGMLDKLNEIQDGIAFINKTYNNETVEIMADILSENVSQKANEKAKDYLKHLKDKAANESNPKKKEQYTKEFEKAVTKLKSEEGITRQVILKSLKEGSSEDINWLDLWFTPAVTSSSELISPFMKLLKDKLEDARQELIQFERQAGEAFEKFGNFGNKDNPAEFNKGLYEEVEVFDKLDEAGKPIFKKRMMFVSPIDLNKFYKEKAIVEQMLNKAEPKYRSAIIGRYYQDNFVRKPQKDITVRNPVTNEEIVIEEGIDTLIEKQRELLERNVITEIDFNEFVRSSKGYVKDGLTYYNEQFLMINPVKFKNKAYDELQSSPKKKYYDFLIGSYFKSQARLPRKMGYTLPSIHKSGYDSIREGGLINYIKYEGSQLLNVKPEEVNLYGEEGKSIPLVYNFEMESSDVSLDLIQSIVMYEAESLEYDAKFKLADTGEVLLSLASKSPIETDEAGNKYFDKFAEQAGIKDEFLKYKRKLGGNNIAAMLAMTIDAQIYGKLNIPTKTKILGMNADKLVNGVMRFASVTQVGGNPIGSVANWLQAALQANIEAAAKDSISDMSWQKSRLIYDKHILDYIKDLNSPYSKSLIGQLIDLYDPMQGEYKDSAGRNISKSMFKKMWSSNSWFAMQHMGEHAVQVRTMIAMMLDTKAIDKTGKYINLYDAYILDEKTGKIKLKEGVRLQGKSSSNGLISRDFQSSLHGLNKKLHGVYNKQDKINIERHWYGRLITMYKKFLAPGLKRRFKALGYDQELGTVTEGYMSFFYKNLFKEAKQLGRFLIGSDNGFYHEHEKQNLRRARREILIVAATGALVMLLTSLIEGSDDDDEKKNLRYFLYLTMRINNELGIYGTIGDPQNILGLPSPAEMYKTVKNPIPAFSVTDKLIKVLQQATDPTAVYERDSGVWEKGDSKLWAKFLKFWGYNGVNFDPENSIKFMQMSTK
jgi:hypothetical protein